MNPKAKEVAAIEEYKLHVKFENGEEKVFDMKPYLLYPVYEELADKNLFKEAYIQYGTVVWNQDIDIDPDRLYLESR